MLSVLYQNSDKFAGLNTAEKNLVDDMQHIEKIQYSRLNTQICQQFATHHRYQRPLAQS